MSVSNQNRLKRLRDLLDELERLPPSAERERMLREVRARVVDVDTGESPRAMLPAGEDPMAAPGARPPATNLSKPVRRAIPAPAAKPRRVARRQAVSRPVAEASADPPPLGDVLSLDDAPSATGMWTRGLRG